MAAVARALGLIKIQPIRAEHNANCETVVQTFFTKFPHPSTPDLQRIENLEDKYDAEKGERHRRRRYHIRNTAGWPLSSLLGWSTVVFEEKSVWVERTRTLHMTSYNITGSTLLRGTEESSFAPHPTEPDRTVFAQTGGVEASSWFGPFVGAVESFVAPSFLRAGSDAVQLLDQVLAERYGVPRAGLVGKQDLQAAQANTDSFTAGPGVASAAAHPLPAAAAAAAATPAASAPAAASAAPAAAAATAVGSTAAAKA